MQITHHTENQVEKTNVPRFLQTMKALAPRSYEKAFNGMDEQVVIFAMSKAIDGLSKQQLQVGLDAMFEQGYCPDPIMFRKWCLGIKGIGDGVNPIHASYRGKYAAIANIEAWLSDSSTTLTNAEREAYNRVYVMFDQLRWSYSDKKKFYAYEAFKDSYVEVVNENVAANICQFDSEPPEAIKPPELKVIRKDYLSTVGRDCDSKKTEQAIKDLVAQGMSVPEAYMSLAKANK